MMRRLLRAACAMLVMLWASPTQAAEAAQGHIFGVLQTRADRAKSNRNAGVRLAVLSVAWNRFEPEASRLSDAYIAEIQQTLRTFRDNGLWVALDLGLQYPPAWVRQQTGSRFVNQYGDAYNEDGRPGANGVNAVFNSAMRDLQAAYVRNVVDRLGTDFYAVRLGWGYYGELNYPDRKFNGRDNCYWAYDEGAQGRGKLPDGIAPCPVPGWIPGTPSAGNIDARRFADWYLGALKNYHDWQIATVRRIYPGRLAMMYPSWGVRPGQLEAAISRNLDGSTPAEKNGEIQRGFDFGRFIDGNTDPRLVVYCTWLDADPAFGDDRSPDPARWSPIHYLADVAGRHPLKLEVWGENTGRGGLKQMQLSFDRMRQYNLIGLVWAFEEELYDPSGRYATIADYARLIADDH